MRVLARRAVRRLRGPGRRVALAAPLRALPKVDSVHLDAAGRAEAARHAFTVRPEPMAALRRVAGAGATVILVDDVITTGATLAAIASLLARCGVKVNYAVTVAATVRRNTPTNSPDLVCSRVLSRSNANVLETRGDYRPPRV
jgi:predicted amidophosphoribosyltransferase